MQLIEAKKSDWKILLEWRNDITTRENSISSDIISEEEHRNWFLNSLNNSNRKIYIVVEKDNLIGTTRADKVNGTTIISWTVAPNARGKGYGKLMVGLLVKSLYGKILAIVKENNIPSKEIAKYAGLSLNKKERKLLYYTLDK